METKRYKIRVLDENSASQFINTNVIDLFDVDGEITAAKRLSDKPR